MGLEAGTPTSSQMIHFIHGIRDNGEHTTKPLSRLVYARTGQEALNHVFPIVHALDAYRKAETGYLAEIILQDVSAGDSVVCHSHGAGVALEMLKRTEHIKTVVMLSPAVERRQPWRSLAFERLYCLHNPLDLAIMGGALLPFHLFGLAGAFGFKGGDARVENIKRRSMTGPFNHTAPYFRAGKIEALARFIALKM